MLKYLASPYTHSERRVENKRAKQATICAARLINAGHHVFSPVAHCHHMNRLANLQGKWEYWREFDEKMLSACDELWVLTLPHWESSVGIQAEIAIMRSLGKPIRYVDPPTLEVTDKPQTARPLPYAKRSILQHERSEQPA